MLGKSCNIKAEEYRSRWGARASKPPETPQNQSDNPAERGKASRDVSTGCGYFGKQIWPLAAILAVAAAAFIGAVAIPLLAEPHCPAAVVIGDALRLAGCGQ